MKKYSCLIILLLIMVPTIWAMEITNKDNTDNSEKLSIHIQELCDLFSVQPEKTFGFSSSVSSQDFLKFTNSINAINDYSTLRQGIFKTIQILILIPQEEKNARKELKSLCKTMHKRLVLFTDTESRAKKYCYNILDCLSDDEEEQNPNISEPQIRKNFDKYKLIDGSINTTNKNKNNIILSIQQRTNIIIGKALEIEQLKRQLNEAEQEYIELRKQEAEDKEEIEAIKIASNLLKTSASKQLLTMQQREQELQKQGQETMNHITELTEKKSQLKNPIEIAENTLAISTSYTKLMKIKIEISNVTKHLNDAKEQPGIQKSLKNVAWYFNLYNYPSSTPLNKD